MSEKTQTTNLEKLESRIARIEQWIDLWETYDSGWNKYRKKGKRRADSIIAR